MANPYPGFVSALFGLCALVLLPSISPAQTKSLNCSFAGRAPSEQELQAILRAHTQWVGEIGSQRRRGERADLCRANLQKIELNKVNLSMANLFEADLSEARLHRAKLTDAFLHRADMSQADLS